MREIFQNNRYYFSFGIIRHMKSEKIFEYGTIKDSDSQINEGFLQCYGKKNINNH